MSVPLDGTIANGPISGNAGLRVRGQCRQLRRRRPKPRLVEDHSVELVADLESRLGTRLLQRTTRKLSLTQEGENFLERSRALLDGVEEAEAQLRSHTGEAIGHLRVNVPVTFGLLQLAHCGPASWKHIPASRSK